MSFHTDEALLRYEHVDVSFEGCAVLHDISISLGRGEILAVVGESGCGKSTLLRAAVKLLGASGLITRVCWRIQRGSFTVPMSSHCL